MKDKYSVIKIKTNTVVFTSNNYLETQFVQQPGQGQPAQPQFIQQPNVAQF